MELADLAEYFQFEPLSAEFSWFGHFFSKSLPPGWSINRDGSTWKFVKDGRMSRKHPLHDRMKEVYLSCRVGDDLEIYRLCISILFKSRGDDDLIFSPKFIFLLAEIFKVPKLGRQEISILREFLKTFEAEYYRRLEISRSSVSMCSDALAAIGEYFHAHGKLTAADLGRGLIQCAECIEKFPATVFCYVCCDALCKPCFMNMHSRGERKTHQSFEIAVCQVCLRQPARLSQPGNLSGNFCSECYATKYFKSLPPAERINLPKTIIFPDLEFPGFQGREEDPGNWFPFYDSTGSCYLFNFETSETKRPKVER